MIKSTKRNGIYFFNYDNLPKLTQKMDWIDLLIAEGI